MRAPLVPPPCRPAARRPRPSVPAGLRGPIAAGGRPRGAVLLLMLMVLAILIVVVGQFSLTAVIDRKVVFNHETAAQMQLDLRAGSEAALGFLENSDEAGEGVELSLESEEAAVTVKLSDEAGKFNLNSLREPPPGVPPEKAEALFRRLAASADDPPGVLPAGFTDAVVAHVRGAETPLLTLASLTAVEGVTLEMVYGAEAGQGLSALFTVHGDGRIRPGAGNDRALENIVAGAPAGAIEAALDLIKDPKSAPPLDLGALVAEIAPWITWEGRFYTADITASRGGNSKRTVALLEDSKEGPRLLFLDELK